MKKQGFTLAEVLITLTIIGVVAALTMPAIIRNIGGAKIGPSLSKLVNMFENGSQTMMMEEERTTLADEGSDKKYEFDDDAKKRFQKYFPMSKMTNGTTIPVHDAKDVAITVANTAQYYNLKDGKVLIFDEGWISCPTKNEAVEPYKGCIGTVAVVLNGKSKDSIHRVGRDVFHFIIDNSGSLIATGSNTYKEQYKYTETCNRKATGNDAAKSLAACTGDIADNGWKAPW